LPSQHITADSLAFADDWRPGYHFSPGAELPRLGAAWSVLSERGVSLVDGWRYSDSRDSSWYMGNVSLLDLSQRDSATGEYVSLTCGEADRQRAKQLSAVVDHDLVYHMRHIEDMRVQPEAHLMAQPVLDDIEACVSPGDIVLRRVGSAMPALISSYHRRHPIDANMAIIRGLPSRERVWLAYCMSQPLYKSFLEQPFAITTLVRVGLKRLAAMPVAECPPAFYGLADDYLNLYDALMRAEDKLHQLRAQVNEWVRAALPNGLNHSAELINKEGAEPISGFFSAQDIGAQLSLGATQQSALARRLVEEAGFVRLTQLAEINPKSSLKSGDTSLSQGGVLKIGDLDGQLDFRQPKAKAGDDGWRFHKRPLSQFDVLVSSFVQEPKVAIVQTEPAESTRASEQLAVLSFHRTPGAYALLMDTPLLRQQIAGLATGTVQRFVQPKMLDQLVLPVLDREDRVLANRWHNQLLELLEEKTQAQLKMSRLKEDMFAIFRKVHPVSDVAGEPKKGRESKHA